MAFTNFEKKIINAKIIYFGMEGSGKSENLRSLLQQTNPQKKDESWELSSERSDPRFFDFLPIEFGKIRDFELRLHLFTLPSNALFETTLSVMLRGVDGVIFVVDSSLDALAENLEAEKKFKHLLRQEGVNVSQLVQVIQYNKRDLSESLAFEILQKAYNQQGLPAREAVAAKGLGTLETLHLCGEAVRSKLGVNATDLR